MTAPLVFQEVPLGARGGQSLTLEVAARQTVALLGDEDSGVGRLGGYALGLDRPPHGRALVFGTEILGLPERERLAFRRRVGTFPRATRCSRICPCATTSPCRCGSAAPRPR